MSLSQNQLSEEDRSKLKVSRWRTAVVHCWMCSYIRQQTSALECQTKVFSARTCVFVSNLLVLSLQEVAAVDGLYRIRVPRVSLQADRQAERQVEGYLTAFVRAVCPSHSAVSAESGLKWGGNHRLGHNNPICTICRIARQSHVLGLRHDSGPTDGAWIPSSSNREITGDLQSHVGTAANKV